MLSSLLLLVRLASIFLYVTPCVNDTNCEPELSNTKLSNTKKTFEIVLEDSRTGFVFCGGTLITNYYVLTAADCVYNRQPGELLAFSGITHLSKRYDRSKVRSVDEIIVHESYDPRDWWRNNIALLRLGRLILTHNCSTFDPWVNKAFVLQKDEFIELVDEKFPSVRLSGFGIISELEPPASDELLTSCTNIVDWSDCRIIYYYKLQYNITNSLICIYDPDILLYPNQTYRISDVGSSVIFKENFIIGIALNVSEDFKLYNYPILVTNVLFYYDWIDRVINRYDEDDVKMKIFQTSGCCKLLDCYFLNSITIAYFILTILVLTQTYA